jgi:hypothetical protein
MIYNGKNPTSSGDLRDLRIGSEFASDVFCVELGELISPPRGEGRVTKERDQDDSRP